jgi:hypothetical protein
MLSLVVAPVAPYVTSASKCPSSVMRESEQPIRTAAGIDAYIVATATGKKRNRRFITVLLDLDVSLMTKGHE